MEMSNEQTYRSKAERHRGARKLGVLSRISPIAGRLNVVILIIVIIVLLALIG